MYLRSWAVLTCNIPHETVFKVHSFFLLEPLFIPAQVEVYESRVRGRQLLIIYLQLNFHLVFLSLNPFPQLYPYFFDISTCNVL